MRTFIALDLPPDFADDAAALARQLSASIEARFLPRDAYHLTLAFLGDVDEPQILAAIDALEAACADIDAVPLRSDGLGTFGRSSDATLWLGIAAAPELELLVERLRAELAACGIPFDGKPFKAHLTLARHARIPRIDLPSLAFPGDDEASSVTLYKSTLDRAGALYKPLHTLRLGSSSPSAARSWFTTR